MFTAVPNNAPKKKKKQETIPNVSQGNADETDAEEYVTEKFGKNTKIPNQKTQQGKNNSQKGGQSSTVGNPVKRGRKPKDPPPVLKKKPQNMFSLKERFKSGYQSDARHLPKPRDSLVNYRLLVTDRKSITFFNNEYLFNDEVQVIPTIFFTQVYYEKKENLLDPENDDGRREMHVKFNTKEYPLIMKAMRELRARNKEIFKNIPDDDHELTTTEFIDDDDDEEEEEEEEEDDVEYEDVD